jgi:hypothetical protein
MAVWLPVGSLSLGWRCLPAPLPCVVVIAVAFACLPLSCSKCKEVRCKNQNFKDGYGQWLDRSSVCYDESASVVVMVTDTCPCHYPNNYHSNKRVRTAPSVCVVMYNSTVVAKLLCGRSWGLTVTPCAPCSGAVAMYTIST